MTILDETIELLKEVAYCSDLNAGHRIKAARLHDELKKALIEKRQEEKPS